MTYRFAALALLVGLSGCADRPPIPPTTSPPVSRVVAPDALLFLDFDANRDRRVDTGELQAGTEASWNEIAEGAATAGQIAVRDWLDRVLGSDEFDFSPVFFDENLDGRISKTEFANALRRRFTALDADHDGVLTRAELSRRAQASGRPGGPGGGIRRGGPGRNGGEEAPAQAPAR